MTLLSGLRTNPFYITYGKKLVIMRKIHNLLFSPFMGLFRDKEAIINVT